jgi:6,7-dimethyl-8-ribityllumazine synthase
MSNYRVIDGAAALAARTGSTGVAARGRRVAIAAARFHADIVDAMLRGAVAAWERQGGAAQDLVVVRTPGAYELPLAAKRLAETGRFDAVVALGCVIRGDTAHFDFVAGEAARGLARAAYDTGVPVAFGVLTTENVAQALERALPEKMDKGGEALESALEMALTLREISGS